MVDSDTHGMSVKLKDHAYLYVHPISLNVNNNNAKNAIKVYDNIMK